MTALLRAELIKLRTTRTFSALVGIALALTLLVVGLSTSLGDGFTEESAADVLSGEFTSLFILMLGVIGTAGEWRHRTITGTVLSAPDRLRLLVAKVLAYAAAGAVLSLIVTAVAVIVGSAILAGRGEATPDLARLLDVVWRNLIIAALLGALGACVGALVRNQLIAMIGLLVFAFIVEPLLLGFAPDYGRFGPTIAAPSAILEAGRFDGGGSLALDFFPALATMLAWVGVLFGAAVATLRSRDLV